MKKISLAVAVAAALTAGAANAYTMAEQSNGLVVPNVYFDANGNDTVIGLISRLPGTVYWTFFDQDSNHVTDGQFPMTADDFAGFDWRQEAGRGLEGKHGYLVFTLATSGASPTTGKGGSPDITLLSSSGMALTGNAFVVNTSAQDVSFVPTLGLNVNVPTDGPDATTGDYQADLVPDSKGVCQYTATPVDLTTMNACTVWGAYDSHVYPGSRVDMRYFIDGQPGGNDTDIVIWSAPDLKGTYTVNMYDDNQDRKSVNFTLPNAELNNIDPEQIVGAPAAFTDGFIAWTVPSFPAWENNTTGGPMPPMPIYPPMGVLSYSVVSSTAFGATQTLLATTDRLMLID